MTKFVTHWFCLSCGLLLVGCQSATPPAESSNDSTAAKELKQQYLLDSEPANAQAVGLARQELADGDSATMVGIIGGSVEPFVDGLAAFTIVDPSVPYCVGEGENCPTPWDYCCTQDQVKENIATVKIVDASGALVSQDARDLLGLKELNEVVVTGTVSRDEQGNLTIATSELFIKG